MQEDLNRQIIRDISKILGLFESITFKSKFTYPVKSRNIENLLKYPWIFKKFSKLYHEINYYNYHAYNLYCGTKSANKNITTNEAQFLDFFRERFKNCSNYLNHSFWKFDNRTGIARKESVRAVLLNGFFLKKKSLLYNENAEMATSTQPLFDFTLSENSEKYLWVYGKSLRVDFTMIRFYFCFHPDPLILFDFVKEIKSQFDDAFIPFALKFYSDPEGYNERSDTCVLYVPRKFAILTFAALARVYVLFKNKNFFVDDKPMFTKKIVNGISFGEDPDEKMHLSFGTYKCAVITLSYFKLKKKAHGGSIDLYELISEINNFDVEGTLNSSNWIPKFYLNKKSKFDYFSQINYFLNIARQQKIKPNHSQYLDLAKRIGLKLVSDAYWFENSNGIRMNCYWISDQKNKDTSFKEFRVLNNEFIKGRLGISFLLRKLYDSFPDHKEFDTCSYRAAKDYLDFKNPSEETKWFVRNSEFFRVGWENEKFNPDNTVFTIERNKNASKSFLKIDAVISGIKQTVNKILINQLIEEMNLYLDEGKPFYLFETDEVFPTFNGGLAYFGYFFLKLARPEITNIPLKINYIE